MELPKRKRNRLCCYDYSSDGGYFVTICTNHRKKILCDIGDDGNVFWTSRGIIAEKVILKITERYPAVRVDQYVVMPNHIHLLLVFERRNTIDPAVKLGDVIGWYKYHVTKEINAAFGNAGDHVFQRSYHDHVIRGQRDYEKIWEYIATNPLRWSSDCFYVE